MSQFHYEYAFPVPLRGNVETVFRALTEATALENWFAERVDVDLREGGAFRFWGRHTYGQPARKDAHQVVVSCSPPRELAYTWRLLDCESIVSWTLEPAEGAESEQSMITVRHDFDALPPIGRAEELIDDLWRIHIGALCFYLDGEKDLFRPDFADQSPEVRTEIVIDAPRDRVFAALVMPEHIKRWFPAPDPFVDPRVGGEYGFGFKFEKDGETMTPPPMKILAFVDNEELKITWPDWRMNHAVPDQTVQWLLKDIGSKTRLTLVHSGFTRAVDVSDYPFGWPGFLEKIRDVAHAMS